MGPASAMRCPTMNEDEFLAHVRERASLASTDEARVATGATLRVLGSCISEAEAERLAARLPEPFGTVLPEERDTGPETFDAAAFVERVGERESERGGIDASDAERHTKAVASALNDFVLDDELETVCERLPEGYDRLFDPTGAET